MKTTTLKAIACAIVIFFATGCKEEKPVIKSATMEQLGQPNRDFAAALIKKDAQSAANIYTEEASILPPNEPIIIGRENIKKYWEGLIEAGLIDVKVQTLDAKSDGDLGYEIGSYELKFQDSTGKTYLDKGKYTEILKRKPDGNWVSIFGMWSADSPEPK